MLNVIKKYDVLIVLLALSMTWVLFLLHRIRLSFNTVMLMLPCLHLLILVAEELYTPATLQIWHQVNWKHGKKVSPCLFMSLSYNETSFTRLLYASVRSITKIALLYMGDNMVWYLMRSPAVRCLCFFVCSEVLASFYPPRIQKAV